MNILILGGTRFVGRYITETLLKADHQVTILTRGKSPDDLPPKVERLRGDRDEGLTGLDELSGRTWDVCVDVCGYTPLQVQASAEKLCHSVGRYVFVSTVSVYADFSVHPICETDSLLPPASHEVTEITAETYGPLKVACEGIIRNLFPSRFTLLRPQIVAGPHDQSGRYSYWVHRALQGGEMLAPGDGSDHLQVIDVRDIARFVQRIVEQNTFGIFNLAGPRRTWSEFMGRLGVEKPVWVPASVLASAGSSFPALPLFCPEHPPETESDSSGVMHVSNTSAISAGLTLTDPDITVRDTRAWLTGKTFTPVLSLEQEADLINLASNRIPKEAPQE